MPNVSAVARRSILATVSPEEEAARRNELQDLPNAFKKVAALAIHEVAIHYPEQLGKLVGLDRRRRAAEFIAAGFDALVFKDGHDVIKVHKASIGRSSGEQKQIVRSRNRMHAIMHASLPEYTLPQRTVLGNHPDYPSVTAAVTHQRYVDKLKDTNLFHTDHQVNSGSLEALVQQGDFETQLVEFVSTASDLRDSHQLLPDLWGRQNLVLNGEGKLLMIDGHPLDMYDPLSAEVVEQTNQRLTNLQQAVAAL